MQLSAQALDLLLQLLRTRELGLLEFEVDVVFALELVREFLDLVFLGLVDEFEHIHFGFEGFQFVGMFASCGLLFADGR